MTPPPATPKKRRLRLSPGSNEATPRHTLKTPPRIDWSSSLQNLRNTFITLFNDFTTLPLGPMEQKSPDHVYNAYNCLRLTLTDLVDAVDDQTHLIEIQHPHLAHLAPKFTMGTQTDDPPAEPKPEPKWPVPEPEPEPEPTPPSQSYAAAASHVPRQQLQAPPRHQPSTRKAKTPFKPLDPARLVVELKNFPALPIRSLSAPEFFRRLTDSCAKVPGAPAPLGVHWNRKENLIISFPAGTTRTSINTLFPTIRSLVGTEEKPVIRFDVPWHKLHLAGIRARNDPDSPITSEEELRRTLLLNPALRSLSITVQPTWLKKPGTISGTHYLEPSLLEVVSRFGRIQLLRI